MNIEEKMILCTRLRLQRNRLEDESNMILKQIWKLEKEIEGESQ